jgi:DNA polymerase-1
VTHLILVDGSSYIYRAYHAVPPMARSDGMPVNAVYGFCFMLWKLLRTSECTHIAVVFDKAKHTFRNDIYHEYKAHRPPPPDDLVPQFTFIRDAVRAFNIPSVEQAGFEADDLIATYAREADGEVTIISSDKDLMQIVNNRVTMYDTMRDRRIGINEVVEKFGVYPGKVVDVLSLIGDPTDNVPGVPGIGAKIAAQLITEYGDLETLLDRVGEVKQEKRRLALTNNAELARLSKRLVTLNDRVELDVPLDALTVRQIDNWRLLSFFRGMEFYSLANDVPPWVNPLDEPIEEFA